MITTKEYRICKHCGKEFKAYNTIQPVCNYICALEWNRDKKKTEAKEWNKTKRVMRVDTHAKEYRKKLQDEINKLARIIDAKFYDSCIDCGRPYGNQVDAAHYFSRGQNSTLRYHLDNLHSAASNCNQFSDTHREGYLKGLESRYGTEYKDHVLGLPLANKSIKLTNQDVVDKLKIVRLLIRTHHTFKFDTALQYREMFNKIIGIY